MVDFSKLNDMVDWEQEKALYLVKVAKGLGMDTSGYGELAVNQNSGYTYLWLEDYQFTLYMPISCKLQKSDVYALYSDPYDGEETEIVVGNKTLKQLEDWAEKLSKKSELKEKKGG